MLYIGQYCAYSDEVVKITRNKKMTQNAQEDFLSDIKKNEISVTVFLVNGVKLQGVITFFDAESLLLRRDGHTQLVYKHAVSTIMPSQAIDVSEN